MGTMEAVTRVAAHLEWQCGSYGEVGQQQWATAVKTTEKTLGRSLTQEERQMAKRAAMRLGLRFKA